MIVCCTNIAFFSISFEAPITFEEGFRVTFTRTGPERGGLLRTYHILQIPSSYYGFPEHRSDPSIGHTDYLCQFSIKPLQNL